MSLIKIQAQKIPNEKDKIVARIDHGGGSYMDNHYVTHQELENALEKLMLKNDNHFDKLESKIDLKFEQNKVWFFITGISIVGAIAGVIAIFD